MTRLTWLHLSDWHQKDKDFDRQVVCDALIRDISNRVKIDSNLAQIDFIVFSGDVAFSGKEAEYQAAKDHLFDPVLRATALSSERLFVVPGNHDLDRQHIPDMLPPALQKVLNEEECKAWLTDEKKRKRLLEPFAAFSAFVNAYTKQDSPEYASIRVWPDIGGKKVALLGLNSAWMCGRNKDAGGEINDYGYTLLGEPQIHDALSQIAEADVRLVILHHSFDWLAEFDRHRVEERLGKAAHFILCGHQHFPQIKIIHGTGGDCINIPAGASYERRTATNPRYTNAYNFVSLDLSIGKGIVYLRRWSDPKNAWIADVDSYDDGKYEFDFPKGLQEKRPHISHSSLADSTNLSLKKIKEPFDVFFSHNNKDRSTVGRLAKTLKARGLKVWLDEWELVPGRPFIKVIEEMIKMTRSAVVLVGKDGLGPWEIPEMRACLSQFVRRNLPVIPVLLPGAPMQPKLPPFLNFMWVDLRNGLTEEGLNRLEWGITGVRSRVAGSLEIQQLVVESTNSRLPRPEPSMNLENELDAFKKMVIGEDAQTRLILVTGEGGMGKSHLLGLYQQIAYEYKFNVLYFSLGPQVSAKNCIDQIVVKFGLDHFYYYNKFLLNNPLENFSLLKEKIFLPEEEQIWQHKLTYQFFKDLEDYNEVSPMVILFDQYEKADQLLTYWLTQDFLPCIYSAQYPIIVVVSGREYIELPFSIKEYRHFHLTGVALDWYHRYVEACKLKIDSKLIDEFHRLLKGRPKEFIEYVRVHQRLQGSTQ